MPGSHAMKKYQAGGYVGPDYSQLWRRQAEENNGAFDALSQQPAPAQPHIRIAPPGMSPHAQNLMAQIMGRSTLNAGSALGKIANVWITKHNADREAEQKRQYLNDQEQRRGVWAQQLHSGASLRDIATHDPGVMSDSSFLDFEKNDNASSGRRSRIVRGCARPIWQRRIRPTIFNNRKDQRISERAGTGEASATRDRKR